MLTSSRNVESFRFPVDAGKTVEHTVDAVDVVDAEDSVVDVDFFWFIVDTDKDAEDAEDLVKAKDAVVNANLVFLHALIKIVDFVDEMFVFCCSCCFFLDLFLFLRCFCRDGLSIGRSSDSPRW